MNIRLAENIKTLRRERKMTQEQLAEALGVTAGAVYKWESGQSVPDISLILELADLFDTSTDVLLGYEWKTGNAGAALARIISLTKERRYGEASQEAEKVLTKYPNRFDIVYQCGVMYQAKGEANKDHNAYKRAVVLLEHACELLPQNTDSDISEVSTRSRIADCYLYQGYTEEALKILKKYNVCGVNNAQIGMILADFLHDADGAEEYLGKAFGEFIDKINAIMVGFTNVFFLRKDYRGALDCIDWLRNTLRGIQPGDEWTVFDKYDCVLLETYGEVYCFLGDSETARRYFKEALSKAKEYDRRYPNQIHRTRLYAAMGMETEPGYELYGKTAMECLMQRIQTDEGWDHPLYELWQEVLKEDENDVSV